MMGALVISAYDRDGYNSLPKWIHAVGEQFGIESIDCCVIRSWEWLLVRGGLLAGFLESFIGRWSFFPVCNCRCNCNGQLMICLLFYTIRS